MDIPQDDEFRTALDACQEALDYRFRDEALLLHCLTHSSIARTRLASNERLEFLGDAVLGFVVCEELYRRFPELEEGELTRLKSSIVSRTSCANAARRCGVDVCLFVGKGLQTSEMPASVASAAMEALFAGVYLDGGLDAARKVVLRTMGKEIDRVLARTAPHNFKSQLQQYCQREFGETPYYRLLDERGPDHSKAFQIAAVIGARAFPAAWGPSKKEAEQLAAANALALLQGNDDNEEFEASDSRSFDAQGGGEEE